MLRNLLKLHKNKVLVREIIEQVLADADNIESIAIVGIKKNQDVVAGWSDQQASDLIFKAAMLHAEGLKVAGV